MQIDKRNHATATTDHVLGRTLPESKSLTQKFLRLMGIRKAQSEHSLTKTSSIPSMRDISNGVRLTLGNPYKTAVATGQYRIGDSFIHEQLFLKKKAKENPNTAFSDLNKELSSIPEGTEEHQTLSTNSSSKSLPVSDSTETSQINWDAPESTASGLDSTEDLLGAAKRIWNDDGSLAASDDTNESIPGDAQRIWNDDGSFVGKY